MESVKDPMNWAFYSRIIGDVTILAHRSEGECWGVYYKRPKYSFMHAFNLPLVFDVERVFEVAEKEINNYIGMLYGF